MMKIHNENDVLTEESQKIIIELMRKIKPIFDELTQKGLSTWEVQLLLGYSVDSVSAEKRLEKQVKMYREKKQ